jgi:AcrR family transcriptional regulator
VSPPRVFPFSALACSCRSGFHGGCLFINWSIIILVFEQLVNKVRLQTNPDRDGFGLSEAASTLAIAPRKRLSVVDRERQILNGAIQFFATHGLSGQLRDLAKSIGVTHTLLYHYYPTKQALLDRVYAEVFEGRWRSEWETLLDDPRMSPAEKLTAFYDDYTANILTREFVRILVFSGLTDHSITDRFFEMLRQRLFPRLIRETRKDRGASSRARATKRELELLMGLHGGIFYVSIRRWLYGQSVHSSDAFGTFDQALIRDRVDGYLAASRSLFAAPTIPPKKRAPNKQRSQKVVKVQ